MVTPFQGYQGDTLVSFVFFLNRVNASLKELGKDEKPISILYFPCKPSLLPKSSVEK